MDTKLKPPDADGRSWTVKFPGTDGEWEWLHFDLLYAQARQQIEEDLDLPAFARTVLTGTDESLRIVTDGNVVTGVLPAYARSVGVDEFEITHWHFAMTRTCLITGRRRATRTLVNLWEGTRGGLNPAGPSALIDLCIVEFVREVRARLATVATDLDRIEDVLIDGEDTSRLSDLGGRLGIVRREATRAKRVLAPLSRALHEDAEDLPDWAGVLDQGVGNRAVHAALDDIAALADRARSLQDELTTLLAGETNRRLYIVSVVTTLFIPATFVTGFFGMNTGGLLWAGEEMPYGTLYAAVACGAAVLITLLILYSKRLL